MDRYIESQIQAKKKPKIDEQPFSIPFLFPTYFSPFQKPPTYFSNPSLPSRTLYTTYRPKPNPEDPSTSRQKSPTTKMNVFLLESPNSFSSGITTRFFQYNKLPLIV